MEGRFPKPVLSPEWRSAVSKAYTEPDSSHYNFSHTGFSRQTVIYEKVLSYLGSAPADANVLFVGVGADNSNGGTFCASGPFEIAAALEGKGKSGYRMTVLDVDRSNLEACKKRKDIFFERYKGSGDSTNDVWGDYLQFTKQKGESRILSSHPFERSADKLLMSAKIPPSFEKKKRSGEVRFVKGDVATVDLKNFGPFDFVHCINVLYHLERRDRELADALVILAVNNLVANMRTGGILLVDSSHHDTGWNYDVREHPEILENEMRLRLENSVHTINLLYENESHYSYLFYRKF